MHLSVTIIIIVIIIVTIIIVIIIVIIIIMYVIGKDIPSENKLLSDWVVTENDFGQKNGVTFCDR